MSFQGAIEDLQGSEVRDSVGDKVGKVGQVYVNNESNEPSWVTVNTGLFGTRESFVPLSEAKYDGGSITVPYEKAFVKDAPNIEQDGQLSESEESELYRYYGLSDGAGAPAEGQQSGRRAGDGVPPAAGGAPGQQSADRTQDGTRPDAGDPRERQHGGQARGGAQPDGDSTQGQESVTLHEERLRVGTERVETGRVRLRKHVVTETKQVEVPVSHEEVVVERVPANGETGGSLSEDESEAEVTLTEERPVVSKETVATEQVNVGTRTVEGTETVTGEVGHEEVDITDADGRAVGDTDPDTRT